MCIEIETKRLRLRNYKEGDENQILYFILQNKNHLKDVIDEWEFAINDLNGAKDYIKKKKAGWVLKTILSFGIWLKEDNSLIGQLILFKINWREMKGQLGYYISKDFQNKGFTSEAVREIVKYVFEVLNIIKLEAYCNKDNVVSRKLLEHNKFKIEEIYDKQVKYTLNKQ
jgi:[ribosomal protein S5]-alanine N-acetyltransferase